MTLETIFRMATGIVLIPLGLATMLFGLVEIVGIPMMERSALHPTVGGVMVAVGVVTFCVALRLFRETPL